MKKNILTIVLVCLCMNTFAQEVSTYEESPLLKSMVEGDKAA